MNWQHLSAILWLRVRLTRNQLKRSGIVNTILTAALLVLALFFSVTMFMVAVAVGVWQLPHAGPSDILTIWNVLIVVFLMMWLFGLITQLQRSEDLALEKLLYFPISLSGTFLVNYLSSFVSLTLIILLPGMIGLCIASAIVFGPAMLATFPLLAGFVFMISAVTYQFRGWLAALMMNKRRRRMIVTLATAALIILCQLPNLWNMTVMRSHRQRIEVAAQQPPKQNRRSNGIDPALSQNPVLPFVEDFGSWLPVIDLAVPPGWLAYGAMAAARRNAWPGLLGSLGFFLIGSASLWRSYHTTLRIYRGEHRAGQTAVKKAPVQPRDKSAVNFLERELPWISEQAAASALVTLRSMMRAPEVKMSLLTMVLFCVIFGTMLFAGGQQQIPEQFRPLLALGVIVMETLSLAQVFLNQFGYDRNGFRAFVLCPSRRRHILLGKNLALAPVVLGIGCCALVVLQFIYPLGVGHFLASLIQMLSAYLALCIAGNQISILLPTAVRAGSMRASSTTAVTALLRLVASMVLMTAMGLLFVPLGIEALLQAFGLWRAFPVYLCLATIVFVVLVLVYRRTLEYQGALLQAREQKVLEAVTTKND